MDNNTQIYKSKKANLKTKKLIIKQLKQNTKIKKLHKLCSFSYLNIIVILIKNNSELPV